MSNTTIHDLLNETTDVLTSIIDGDTPANKAYVKAQVVSALKDLAMGIFPEDVYYISDRGLGDPFYETFASLEANVTAPCEIKLLTQPAEHLLGLTEDIIIDGLNSSKRTIEVEEGDSSIFKNLTIEVTGTVGFVDCTFENCYITGITNPTVTFETCTLNNCIIDSPGGATTFTKCNGFNNKFKDMTTITLGTGSRMILNIFDNNGTVNADHNLTNDLNIDITILT